MSVDVDGCVIDYKGTDVTPETFTKVLTGGDSAGSKVRQSGADDRVFVGFVDHGAVDLIGFLRCATEARGAAGIRDTNNTRARLLSGGVRVGSMFANLPANMNIYATTAANSKESSWNVPCAMTSRRQGDPLASATCSVFGWRTLTDGLRGWRAPPPFPSPLPLTPPPPPDAETQLTR